jgi:hypothetical protein
MKTLIKLIIAAAIIHATWRAGMVYFKYYQLKESMQEIALFSARQSDQDLKRRVEEMAKGLDIPLNPEDISVRRTDNHMLIDASYDERIELLPRYFYPWHFEVNVDALTLVPAQD